MNFINRILILLGIMTLTATMLFSSVNEKELAAETLPKDVSQGWYSKVMGDIKSSEYHFSKTDTVPIEGISFAWQAPNRSQNLRAYADKDAFYMTPRVYKEKLPWVWGLKLAGYEENNTLHTVSNATMQVEKNRVTYQRDKLSEWYINGEKGIEQGFSIPQPITNEDITTLHLKLLGNLNASYDSVKKEIQLFSNTKANVLNFSELKAYDANGVLLASSMELKGDTLIFHVATKGVAYPVMIDPIATTPTTTLEMDQAYAYFGVSVASAGDVNGDGYSDVIVGANIYDNGQTNEGVAFVYLGSSSGLSTSPSVTLESNQASAYFGISVASAGDINGDGYSDIIVGANYYDNGQTNEGAVFVYLGSSSGLSTSPSVTLESNQGSANFAISVASAGDINGDGYSDVIVGANKYDNGQTDEGAAFVYLGSSSGLSTSPSVTLESNQADAYFGISVASAGDINGDGYSDVIVGANKYDNGQTDEGAAFVYLGSSSGLSASPSVTLESNQASANFAISVASAGDINGDGYSDVIVGANKYDNGQTDEGVAFIYLGSSSGLSTSPSVTLESNQADAYFGTSVTSAGDVNGDAYSDVIVGAKDYDNGQTDEGAAFIYLGSSSGLSVSPSLTLEYNQASANFAISVASAGDVNGDGYSDVIVGANYYDNGQGNEGAAFVYLGSENGLPSSSSWNVSGGQESANLGISVASAGDINGDGYSDVIVGANKYDNGQTDEGAVFVYLGSSSGLSTSPSVTLESNQASANFGVSVASAGDVNGDGYSDVIVGASGYDNGQTNEGAVFVYLGSSSGLSTSPSVTLEPNQATAHFGISVASAGDVNGDGYLDVIVGANYYDNGQTDEGAAFIYLGSSSGLSTSPSVTLESNQASANFAISVASAGDINGDGYSDVIVGANLYDDAQTDEGGAFVYMGSSSGLATTPSYTIFGGEPEANLGISVASAGDVNGDGYSDIIVGSDKNDFNADDGGVVFVLLGSSSGVSSSNSWFSGPSTINTNFGYSVASAGDVNGDGYSDIIVGAYKYDNGQTNEGAVFIYLGSASGLSSSVYWQTEVNQYAAFFGTSVASAGDVNGDGYSDVIVGANYYNGGETNEGMAFMYYGNSGGKPTLVSQKTSNNLSFLQYGLKGCENAFNISVNPKSTYGKTPAKLQYELKPKTTPFDGTGLVTSSAWSNASTLSETINMGSDTLYHWRVRVLYNNASVPYAHTSKWYYPVNNIGYSGFDRGTFTFDTISLGEISVLPFPESDGVDIVLSRTINNQCSTSVSVDFDTSSQAASEGKDFYGMHATITWAVDDASDKLFKINFIDDVIDESDESFWIDLSNPVNANIGSAFIHPTIGDNDVSGTDSDGDGVGDDLDPWPNDKRYAIDSDGDGLPDEWEDSNFGDLTTANGTSDTDSDGYDDIDEFNDSLDQNNPLTSEPTRVEAMRRIPPMLETLNMPEQMNASASYDISWKAMGYDESYSTLIALFDCTDKAADACGASFGDNFHYYTVPTPSLVENAPWTYGGEVAKYFTYLYNYTIPATREDGSAWASSGTKIVVRFYQKTTKDADAGKGSLSLMIPGNVTDTYYDSTGRRIEKIICPSGGCL